MTPTKYQKYVFGLKSGHLKIGANGAGAYTIPRSVSYEGWQPLTKCTSPLTNEGLLPTGTLTTRYTPDTGPGKGKEHCGCFQNTYLKKT